MNTLNDLLIFRLRSRLKFHVLTHVLAVSEFIMKFTAITNIRQPTPVILISPPVHSYIIKTCRHCMHVVVNMRRFPMSPLSFWSSRSLFIAFRIWNVPRCLLQWFIPFRQSYCYFWAMIRSAIWQQNNIFRVTDIMRFNILFRMKRFGLNISMEFVVLSTFIGTSHTTQ